MNVECFFLTVVHLDVTFSLSFSGLAVVTTIQAANSSVACVCVGCVCVKAILLSLPAYE
jgi:hypothetical protein